MMNLFTVGMGLLFLAGSMLMFMRVKRWGVAIQIAGAGFLIVAGVMGVLGPGDFVIDLPGHPAVEQMRYHEIVGSLSCAGLLIFAFGYFIDGVAAFRSRKSEMK